METHRGSAMSLCSGQGGHYRLFSLPSCLCQAAAGGTEFRHCSHCFPGNPQVHTCSGTLSPAPWHRAARWDLQAGASAPGMTLRRQVAVRQGYLERRCRSHEPKRYRRRREPRLLLGRQPSALGGKGAYHCASLCLYSLEWDGFVLALQVKHKRFNRPRVINTPGAAASVFRSLAVAVINPDAVPCGGDAPGLRCADSGTCGVPHAVLATVPGGLPTAPVKLPTAPVGLPTAAAGLSRQLSMLVLGPELAVAALLGIPEPGSGEVMPEERSLPCQMCLGLWRVTHTGHLPITGEMGWR